VNVVEAFGALRDDCEKLNEVVRTLGDTITLGEAKKVRSLASEARGWLIGIEKLLETK
jgi:hypothetical protein